MTENHTNAQAVIEAAIRSAEAQPLDDEGRFYSVVTPMDGKHTLVDLDAHREALLPAPRRKVGTYTVHDAHAFAAYLKKHGTAESEVWADMPGQKLTAVINANESANPQWEDYRISYAILHTPAWEAWAAHDGKLLAQQDFAEHIEARAVDILDPAGAVILELAQTFQATTGVEFQSQKILSTGQAQVTYRETIDAKAGKSGQLDIPKTFTLGLIPFWGAEAFKVTARLRFRIREGHLFLGYQLERPEDILRDAFTTVVADVESRIGVPVWNGSR